MKLKIRRTGWVIIVVVAGFAVALALNAWREARIEARVDLGRKLVGRWAADGSKDPLSAGGPITIPGAVRRVRTRAALGLAFDGTTGTVSVPDSPELAVR